MNRVEKKCLFASAGTHGALLLLLFAGPWLVLSKKQDLNLPVLTFIPSMAVDQMTVGGGSPTVTQPPAPVPSTPQPAQALRPPETTPAPPIPQKVVEPEPVAEVVKPAPRTIRPTEAAPVKPAPTESLEPAKTLEKPKFQPSFVESGKNKNTTKEKAPAEAQAQAATQAAARAQAAQRAFAAKVGQSLDRIGSGLSTGTSIDVPGPGGAAYANYRLIVEAMYQRAWILPEEVTEESAVARARVVIRRDGSVIEHRIVKPSGIKALDRSVERALELRFIQPFPEGSTDQQRTFFINFDLKSKRLLG